LDNYTGMGHNYYLYETNGYFTIIPWDLNMAFGTFRMGASQGDIAEFYIDEPVTSGLDSRPLVKRLLAYPPYLERYHQYHEEMLAGDFAEGVLEKRIDQWVTLIRPYVEKDELKFFTMEQFEKGLTEGNAGLDMMGMRRPDNANNSTQQRPEMAMGMPPEMPGMAQQPAAEGQQNQQMRPGGQGQLGRLAQMGNNRGRMGGPGGGGGMGMGAPGLKSFITKRRDSVRKQLDGKSPSKPTAQQRQQNNQWPMMPGPGGMM
ncbi:MAG: CotH kinase family protein, partial [Anaerohalosphaeraceae bacterium]